MKKWAVKNLILTAALVILPLPILLFAHDAPHSTYGCACHNANLVLGKDAYYAAVCVSCHKPGMIDKYEISDSISKGKTPAYQYIKPFSFGDQANPYNNSTSLTRVPNKVQSSHKWLGPDNVPEAGALPPTSPELNPINTVNVPRPLPVLMGNLSCYRCHIFDSAPYSPLLRAAVSEDQLCNDCHRQRNVTEVQRGTHPVNVPYSSATYNIGYGRKTEDVIRTRAQFLKEFQPRPLNVNPGNPSSQLKMKPRNTNNSEDWGATGKIVCTTCHGVHYTDSNSATVDAPTTTQFSSSKGYLLKTDFRRSSSTDRNICTNCHKSKDQVTETGAPLYPEARVKNHDSERKRQNVQCNDCHGGHVEFAGYSSATNPITAIERQPNIYLINRFMNFTSRDGMFKTVRNAKVIFNDVTNKNYNKDSFGVCVACHSSLPTIVGEPHLSNDATGCSSCHRHETGFSAQCTTCHGFPPSENEEGGPLGYANAPHNYADPQYGVFKNEKNTPHLAHAGKGANYFYTCDECHRKFEHNPSSAQFQWVFKNRSGVLAGQAASYNPNGKGTCVSVYCHSDGRNAFKNMTWGGTKRFVGKPEECDQCHDALPSTNAHPVHVASNVGTRFTNPKPAGKGYPCAYCHSSTVKNPQTYNVGDKLEILDRKMHVNGKVDLGYTGTLQEFNVRITSCSSCHNDGRGGDSVYKIAKRKIPGNANWDYEVKDFLAGSTAGDCGQCHSVPNEYKGHLVHEQSLYGPQLLFGVQFTNRTAVEKVCTNCHDYEIGIEGLGSKHVDGSYNVTPGSCNVCHPTTRPAWTGNSNISCGSCHSGFKLSVINGIMAPDKRQDPVSGHGKYTGSCEVCHLREATAHISRSPAQNDHVRRLQPFLDDKYDSNLACDYCHKTTTVGIQYRNMSTHFTKDHHVLKDQGNGEIQQHDMKCSSCHELHGTTNMAMIRTSFAYRNSSTVDVEVKTNTQWVQRTYPYKGLCQVCHTQTAFYKAGVEEKIHASTDDECYKCHKHNMKKGAFAGSGCDSCHGYPPVPRSAVKGPWYDREDQNGVYQPLHNRTYGVMGNFTGGKFEDYTGGGGVHLWHLDHTIKPDDGWGPCLDCHRYSDSKHVTATPVYTNISNVSVDIHPDHTFSPDSGKPFGRYSGYRFKIPNKTGSCVNVACHYQPTIKWSTLPIR